MGTSRTIILIQKTRIIFISLNMVYIYLIFVLRRLICTSLNVGQFYRKVLLYPWRDLRRTCCSCLLSFKFFILLFNLVSKCQTNLRHLFLSVVGIGTSSQRDRGARRLCIIIRTQLCNCTSLDLDYFGGITVMLLWWIIVLLERFAVSYYLNRFLLLLVFLRLIHSKSVHCIP